jgi:hypothetical protein
MGRTEVRRFGYALLSVCASIAVIGCGNSRTPIQPTANGLAGSFRIVHFPGWGITLKAPAAWASTTGQGPLIATFTSGASVVALWSFPRDVRAPHGVTELNLARRRLIRKARSRDPKLSLIRSKITHVGAAPAIELDAIEQINGQPRRVRSTHVFVHRAEVVLDEYAPPQVFHTVDHTVFSPLKHSLLLTGASTA